MKSLFVILILFIPCLLKAQQEMEKLQALIKNNASLYAIERAYTHISRTSAITGETLWLQVYLVDAANKPSMISKVAYVEVIDQQNQPVLQTKINIENGVGSGTLYFPASLSSGNYWFRTYSHWMKNFGAAYYYHQQISIINPFISLPDKQGTMAIQSPRIQFVTGSGTVVAGLDNRINYKISPVSALDRLQVTITNGEGESVTNLNPDEFGTGTFNFTPKAGEKYTALLSIRNSAPVRRDFLPVANEGSILSVIDSLDQLYITTRSVLSTDEPVAGYLVVHQRGKIIKVEAKIINLKPVRMVVSKQDFETGIVNVSVYDNNLKLLADHPYFHDRFDTGSVTAMLDQREYGLRRRVSLTVQSPDLDRSDSAHFSIAVYKVDSLPEPDRIQAIEGLALPPVLAAMNTDALRILKNNVENKRERLNRWQLIERGATHATQRISYLPEINGHLVRARILSDKPKRGIVATLSSPERSVRLHPAMSDEIGEVVFDRVKPGSGKLFLQTNSPERVSLEVDDPFAKDFAEGALPPLNVHSKLEKQILRRALAMQVQDIYSGRDFEEKVLPDSSTFYGKADENYYLDKYTRFRVMEEVIREYVSGVMLRKRKDGFHFLVLDDLNRDVFKEQPLVLLDGVPVGVDAIMAFDPLKIKQIEVMRRRYYLGPIISPGLVSFRTYNGDLGGFNITDNTMDFDYEGPQRRQTFPSPQYTSNDDRSSRIPDHRYLLYWNGDVSLAGSQEQLLQFFTSDLPGTFRIDIEGRSSSGKVFSHSTTFTVRDFNQ